MAFFNMIKIKIKTLLSILTALPFLLLPPANADIKKVKTLINANGCPATLDFKLNKLASIKSTEKDIHLCESYKGKVILIVNTASKCGFTDQFGELEDLYEKYKNKGLVVLGFPSNDFGGQDPDSEEKIASFCRLTYGVKFPMFEKMHAAKKEASSLYQTLGNLAGEFPRWNFHKYLLDTEGNLIASFHSRISPKDKLLIEVIEKYLPRKI